MHTSMIIRATTTTSTDDQSTSVGRRNVLK
ncbi:Uncharacterised protein [Mycobacterium tuberculosis]|nr:Uncharacterised protein [Mycobacterium tuberculosis]CPA23818.1 Uncharacterised protein [Mycobacterium tuberculosis]